MGEFIKEYWPWILIPFVVVLAVIVVLVLMAGGGGSSDFTYNVF